MVVVVMTALQTRGNEDTELLRRIATEGVRLINCPIAEGRYRGSEVLASWAPNLITLFLDLDNTILRELPIAPQRSLEKYEFGAQVIQTRSWG